MIHLWPDSLQPALIRKLAAHELGHAWSFQRPDLQMAWASLRGGLTGQTALEDFAESFYRANYPESGMSFVAYNGSYATDDQLVTMRGWWSGSPVETTTTSTTTTIVTTTTVAPPVTHTVAPQRPPGLPTTTVPDSIPVVVRVPARVAAVLAALRIAGG